MKLTLKLLDVLRYIHNHPVISLLYSDGNKIRYETIYSSEKDEDFENRIRDKYLSKGNKIFLVVIDQSNDNRCIMVAAKDEHCVRDIYRKISPKDAQQPDMITELEFQETTELKRYEVLWYNYISQSTCVDYILAENEDDAREIAIKHIIRYVGHDEEFANSAIEYIDEFSGFYDVTRESIDKWYKQREQKVGK